MNRGILNPVPVTLRGRSPVRAGRSAIAGIQFTREFDPDATRYIARVEERDRQPLQRHVKEAIDNLVTGLKAAGAWFPIRAFGLLSGPRTFAGSMVALRGPDPTPFNFLPAHYTQTGGLVGLAAQARTLDSGFALNSVPRDDCHMSIWLEGLPNATHIGASNVESGGWSIGTNAANANYRLRSGGATTVAGNVGGFYGVSRNNSTTVRTRNAFTSNTVTLGSDNVLLPTRVRVFGNISASGTITASSSTVKAYTLGTDVDLVKIEQCLLRYNAEIQNAPKCRHPEAQNWVYRVYQNTGTVTQYQADVVNAWCEMNETAGIRGLMYRANPFLGGLVAGLVPVYLGPSFGGTIYGSIVDTNANLVAADYSDIVGYTGNGANKYINTTFCPSMVAGFSSNCHLSVYAKTVGTQAAISAYWFHSTDTAQRYVWEIGQATMGVNLSGTTAASPPSASNGALFTGCRSSSTSLFAYRNDSQGVESTAAAPTVNSDLPIFILARNLRTGTPPTNGSSPTFYGNHGLGGYSIGANLTSSQVADYSAAWSSMVSKLGRA